MTLISRPSDSLKVFIRCRFFPSGLHLDTLSMAVVVTESARTHMAITANAIL